MSKSFPKLESDRSTATIYYIDPNCYSPQESVVNYDLHEISLNGIGISAHFLLCYLVYMPCNLPPSQQSMSLKKLSPC